MPTTFPEFVNDSVKKDVHSTDWKNSTAYRCHVLLVREDDGTFSGVVLNLPGAGSCGDSEDEALANVREAMAALIESYQAANQEIPWVDSSQAEIPAGARQKWVLVNG